MSALIPLPVFPHPLSEAQLSVLKEAKARMNVEYHIVPVEGGPGVDGRVLALGEMPPYYCSFAPVLPENTLRVESVQAALEFALADVSERFGHADWLSYALGGEVEYLGEEAL